MNIATHENRETLPATLDMNLFAGFASLWTGKTRKHCDVPK